MKVYESIVGDYILWGSILKSCIQEFCKKDGGLISLLGLQGDMGLEEAWAILPIASNLGDFHETLVNILTFDIF